MPENQNVRALPPFARGGRGGRVNGKSFPETRTAARSPHSQGGAVGVGSTANRSPKPDSASATTKPKGGQEGVGSTPIARDAARCLSPFSRSHAPAWERAARRSASRRWRKRQPQRAQR